MISGNAALDSVTLTAKNAWAGERVPNRVIADSPVPTAQLLLRQAADALAAAPRHEGGARDHGQRHRPDERAREPDRAGGAAARRHAGHGHGGRLREPDRGEYFALAYQVRGAVDVGDQSRPTRRSSPACSTRRARPVFAVADSAPSATIDEGEPGRLAPVRPAGDRAQRRGRERRRTSATCRARS